MQVYIFFVSVKHEWVTHNTDDLISHVLFTVFLFLVVVAMLENSSICTSTYLILSSFDFGLSDLYLTRPEGQKQ